RIPVTIAPQLTGIVCSVSQHRLTPSSNADFLAGRGRTGRIRTLQAVPAGQQFPLRVKTGGPPLAGRFAQANQGGMTSRLLWYSPPWRALHFSAAAAARWSPRSTATSRRRRRR